MGKKKKETPAEQELLDKKKAAIIAENIKLFNQKEKTEGAKAETDKAKDDHSAVSGFGETIKRPVVDVGEQSKILNPPIKAKPILSIKRPSVCICGASEKAVGSIFLCPKCKHTWCKYCFRGQVNCGKCGTKGI